MPDQLQVAFVGCGEIAPHYLPVYRDLDFVRVVACIDTDLEKAKQSAAFLAKHEPSATTDFQMALGPGVDAVVINTPNFVHRSQAVATLRADKHVLLQKPLASNLADAEAIVLAAQASRRTNGLYMSYFDQPLFHDLRGLVAEGRLGHVVHFYAKLMHRHGMRWSNAALQGQPTWRGIVAQTGGGCFIQLAVHYVHMIEWIAGAKTVRVTGVKGKLHCHGLEGEDLAVAILELDSGAVVTLDTAWCANAEQFSIHGTMGAVHYRDNRALSLWSAVGPYAGHVVRYDGARCDSLEGPRGQTQELTIDPPPMGNAANPLNQHRAFLEAARDGRPAFVSIASGLHDMRVVMAVYESAKTGAAVRIEEP
ncbi:MAG TPA: Gfo/Idh/MocA family oxidoreductase [Gemmataceae bacterium]|nr:Gfo/Idh/MocA family oxidoreductase [Gemmataceae bacterium]